MDTPEVKVRMSIFCDVVLPVPLDRAFTYKLKDDDHPAVGGRVVVPFRNEKLIGVVTRDRKSVV